MARIIQKFLSLFLPFAALFMTHPPPSVSTNRHHLAETPAGKDQTLTHLRFYFHDIVSGPDPTAVRVAEAKSTNSSSSFFGAMVMIDDPLTAEPDPKSKRVGQAQGLYSFASKSEFALLMTMTFEFTEGQHKGSSLSILGRNVVLSKMREMPVVGGTGVFRLARGYAQAKTHTFNTTTGDTVVEYNVYVLH